MNLFSEADCKAIETCAQRVEYFLEEAQRVTDPALSVWCREIATTQALLAFKVAEREPS